MKEALYDWMKYLAFFYILLTTVLHLAPSGTYRTYIRFFMGLLLILMLTAPVFVLLGKGEKLSEDFTLYYGQEEAKRTLRELENLQAAYLKKGYEEELGGLLRKKLQERGIETEDVRIYIEGEDIRARLYVPQMPEQGEMEEIRDELLEEWGIGEGEYSFTVTAPGEETVGRSAPSGASSGGDRSPGAGDP
ncbi:MAG: stage III sporulation protein AF [Eubacteriales bacterium]|nr:stage III sporulation protein AF [Eubacteriales bacterium]